MFLFERLARAVLRGTPLLLAVGVFAVSLAYAIVRYNVFADVPWHELPVYVTNKAISVAALVALGMSRIVHDKTRRKRIGLIGAGMSALHVLLSFVVMQPSYLGKLYLVGGTLTANAELSMLVGCVATVLIGWLLYETALTPIDRQHSGASLVRGLGRATLVLSPCTSHSWAGPAGSTSQAGRVACHPSRCSVPRSRPVS
jgi:hypothetical protein